MRSTENAQEADSILHGQIVGKLMPASGMQCPCQGGTQGGELNILAWGVRLATRSSDRYGLVGLLFGITAPHTRHIALHVTKNCYSPWFYE